MVVAIEQMGRSKGLVLIGAFSAASGQTTEPLGWIVVRHKYK
jgi:hypothetical protein